MFLFAQFQSPKRLTLDRKPRFNKVNYTHESIRAKHWGLKSFRRFIPDTNPWQRSRELSATSEHGIFELEKSSK